MDWFKTGKGLRQGCILSLCLFNFYAEDIMKNARLEEPQAGIKIARRNINNLGYADDTILMVESEELKGLLMKVKEKSEKAMTNLDNILKSRVITLPTKVSLVKAMAFPVVIYGCESCTIKKAEH